MFVYNNIREGLNCLFKRLLKLDRKKKRKKERKRSTNELFVIKYNNKKTNPNNLKMKCKIFTRLLKIGLV